MTPSDTTEADAAHRRFLPRGSVAVRMPPPTGGESSESVGGSNGVEGPLKQDQDNNLLPFKSETTDCGATDGETAKLNEPQDETERQNVPKTLPNNNEEQFGFDLSFIKRFYRLHGLLFLRFCSVSTALFTFLVGLVLLRK